MSELSTSEKIITSDDILSKDVIGPDGAVLGSVIKLHIHKEKLELIGITIDKGFMKPDLFIGVDFIKMFGIDSVFLKRMPKENYDDYPVITEDGYHVGMVKEIIMEHGKMKSIVVLAKGSLLKTKRINVPISQVKSIAANVILKKKASKKFE